MSTARMLGSADFTSRLTTMRLQFTKLERFVLYPWHIRGADNDNGGKFDWTAWMEICRQEWGKVRRGK